MKTIWTSKMDKYLRDNYQTTPNKRLAGFLGLKLTVTRNRLYELGLARYNQKERRWTGSEDATLISLCKTTGNVELSKILKRSVEGIKKRIVRLNKKRSIEEINKIVDSNMVKFKDTEFKSGHIPKINPGKAWKTRRERNAEPTEVTLKRIERREKANFYRI